MQEEKNYCTIIIDDIEYELNYPVIGYLSPTRNQTTIDLHLKVLGYTGDKLELDDNIKDDNEENKGILASIKEVIILIARLPYLIISALIEMLSEILRLIFIPADGFMEMIEEQAQTLIIDKLPVLDIPVKLLKKIYETINVGWIGDIGIGWDNLEFMGKVIVPGNAINFTQLINSKEAFKKLYDIYLIFTDAFLSFYFIKYLKKKCDRIFE